MHVLNCISISVFDSFAVLGDAWVSSRCVCLLVTAVFAQGSLGWWQVGHRVARLWRASQWCGGCLRVIPLLLMRVSISSIMSKKTELLYHGFISEWALWVSLVLTTSTTICSLIALIWHVLLEYFWWTAGILYDQRMIWAWPTFVAGRSSWSSSAVIALARVCFQVSHLCLSKHLFLCKYELMRIIATWKQEVCICRWALTGVAKSAYILLRVILMLWSTHLLVHLHELHDGLLHLGIWPSSIEGSIPVATLVSSYLIA